MIFWIISLLLIFLQKTHGKQSICDGTEIDINEILVDKNQLLKYFNDYKLKFAERYQIGNMWKLEWDEQLAVEAEKCFTFDDYGKSMCIEGKGDQYTHPFIEEGFTRLLYNESEFDLFKTKVNSAGYYRESIFTVRSILALLPRQTKIGCVATDFASYADEKQIPRKCVQFTIKCVLGPRSLRTKDERRYTLYFDGGYPGEYCEANDAHSEDGLCVPGPPPPVKSTTPEPEEKEEWDLILNLNSAASPWILLVFIVVML